ncbi:unnamed protein product [Rotaria socialis]|nr:unnamed protein product [Rotaria socialis]CAF4537978.1 unnamed protein product [Rotaria socialis]CAF4933956.1 unnamed protein product [Rotaria socialis]
MQKGCKTCPNIALACLIHKLGIQLTKMPGFRNANPDRTFKLHGKNIFDSDPEPNAFHSVSHTEMLGCSPLDIDRLINGGHWKELTDYTRMFVASHYEMLRLKRKECTLPKIDYQTTHTSRRS